MFVDTLTYRPKHGLTKGLLDWPHLGTYQRLSTGRWRLRIKLKTGGHTWKAIEPKRLPKEIRVHMLLHNVQ